MIDPYIDPKTKILKNLLGITTEKVLTQAEADITYMRLLDSDAYIEKDELNYLALLEMHKYIFGDIYSWAGKTRTLNISKEEKVLGGASLVCTDHVEIERKATEIISDMNSIDWSSLSLDESDFKFGDLIAKLWLIHPFREGNTQTVMRFAGIFAASKGFLLDAKLLKNNASYVRDSLVLYNVPEKPEKNYLLKIVKDSINNY